MEDTEEIQNLVNQINARDFNSKKYQEMKIEELSVEIREAIKFQQESFQKIEELEIKGVHPDLTKYAKMICKNSTEREILKIQEAYLEKIESEYIKSNKK